MGQSDYDEFRIGGDDDESIGILDNKYGKEFKNLRLKEIDEEIDGKNSKKELPRTADFSSSLSSQQIMARKQAVEEFLLKKNQTQFSQLQDKESAIFKDGLEEVFDVPAKCSREVLWLEEITRGEKRAYFQIINSFADQEKITYFCIWLPAKKALVAITPSFLTTIVLKEVKDPRRYTWLNSQWINGKVSEGTAFRLGKISDKEHWQAAMQKVLLGADQLSAKSHTTEKEIPAQVKDYGKKMIDVSEGDDPIGHFSGKQESRIDGLKQIFAQKELNRLINLAKTELDQQAVLEIIRGLKNQGYSNLELAEALGTKIDEELEIFDIFEAVNLMFPVSFEKRRKTSKEDFKNRWERGERRIENKDDFLINKTTEPEIPMICQTLARIIKDVFATEKIQNEIGKMGEIEFSEMNKTMLVQDEEDSEADLEVQQIKNYLFWIKNQEILVILRGKKEEIDSKGCLLVKSLKNMLNETKYFWLDEWLNNGMQEEEGIPVTDDSLIEVNFEKELERVLLEAKKMKNDYGVIPG